MGLKQTFQLFLESGLHIVQAYMYMHTKIMRQVYNVCTDDYLLFNLLVGRCRIVSSPTNKK